MTRRRITIEASEEDVEALRLVRNCAVNLWNCGCNRDTEEWPEIVQARDLASRIEAALRESSPTESD